MLLGRMMYRPFYTAKPVRSQLGTPGDFNVLSQVSSVKPMGSNPPFVTEGFFGSLEKVGLRTESRPE